MFIGIFCPQFLNYKLAQSFVIEKSEKWIDCDWKVKTELSLVGKCSLLKPGINVILKFKQVKWTGPGMTLKYIFENSNTGLK